MLFPYKDFVELVNLSCHDTTDYQLALILHLVFSTWTIQSAKKVSTAWQKHGAAS